jgi:hypothetical protein
VADTAGLYHSPATPSAHVTSRKDFAMQQIMGYYCWIKQVGLDKVDPRQPLSSQSTGTPPTHKAGRMGFSHADEGSGHEDLGDSVDPKSSVLATPGLGTAWIPDIGFAGDPALGVLRYHIVFGDRDAAFAWIHSADGVGWRDGATIYFLLGFGIMGPQFIDPELESYRIGNVKSDFAPFAGTWDPEFKREAYRPDGVLLKRADWTKIDLKPSIVYGNAAAAVKEVENDFMPQWKGQDQVDGTVENLSAWHAIRPVLVAGAIPDPWRNGKNGLTDLIELVGRLIEESLPPLAHFKRKFDVARPVPETKAHLTVPDHPAFPSGHATQAMLVALALGEFVDTAHQDAMKSAARLVAVHRIQAGLHYRMDMDAGIALAEALWLPIRKSAEFLALSKRVGEEIRTGMHTPH